MIYEWFINGQCDAIMYVKAPGIAFDEFETKNFLAANAVQGEDWKERPSPIDRTFYTTDQRLGASLLLEEKSNTQFLRIATAAAQLRRWSGITPKAENPRTFKRLDLSVIRDRAERETTFEYNSIRQMTKHSDPIKRVTLFESCKCGALRSLTDPMGRTTSWRHDIQGRVKCTEYANGSKLTYLYENTISYLRQRVDGKLQVTQYNYNRDDTVSSITYTNSTVATPSVAFTYDANYSRLTSMTDGTGTAVYGYIPITHAPSLGAGQLARVDGPLPNDTITSKYDELGRRVSTAINEVAASVIYDAAGRVTTSTNALGVFINTYDGNSFRKESQSHRNGQTLELRYAESLQDLHLQKITNKLGNTPISEFIYGSDVPRKRITSWSQQSGEQPPSIYSFGYDDGDQLLSALFSEGNVIKTFRYSYDPAGNRLTEQIDAKRRQFSDNALNELTSVEGDASLDATYQ